MQAVRFLTELALLVCFATSCTSAIPKVPEEFLRNAHETKMKFVLEYGSIKAIDAGIFLGKDLKETLGTSSSAGGVIGKIGSILRESGFSFSFKTVWASSPVASTQCVVRKTRDETKLGKVGFVSKKGTTDCTVKFREKTYKLQASSKQERDFDGTLSGDALNLVIVSIHEDTDGTSHLPAIGFKVVNGKQVLGVLGNGYEPTYQYVEGDKDLMVLAGTIVVVIRYVLASNAFD